MGLENCTKSSEKKNVFIVPEELLQKSLFLSEAENKLDDDRNNVISDEVNLFKNEELYSSSDEVSGSHAHGIPIKNVSQDGCKSKSECGQKTETLDVEPNDSFVDELKLKFDDSGELNVYQVVRKENDVFLRNRIKVNARLCEKQLLAKKDLLRKKNSSGIEQNGKFKTIFRKKVSDQNKIITFNLNTNGVKKKKKYSTINKAIFQYDRSVIKKNNDSSKIKNNLSLSNRTMILEPKKTHSNTKKISFNSVKIKKRPKIFENTIRAEKPFLKSKCDLLKNERNKPIGGDTISPQSYISYKFNTSSKLKKRHNSFTVLHKNSKESIVKKYNSISGKEDILKSYNSKLKDTNVESGFKMNLSMSPKTFGVTRWSQLLSEKKIIKNGNRFNIKKDH